MTVNGSTTDIDPAHFRRVLSYFPTGVVAVTATGADGEPIGMAVGSFTSVSLDPPLVAFLPAKSSSTYPKIAATGRFCINILSAEQAETCRTFAMSGADKFADVPWQLSSATRTPRLTEAVAWIECRTATVHDAGDHHIVVGEVLHLEASEPDITPLIFYRGGYGRFSGLTLAAWSDPRLVVPLRYADVARTMMEELADAFDCECLAIARDLDEMVVVASAGSWHARQISTRVAERMPLAPPMGALLVAWEAPEVITEYLQRAGDVAGSPDQLRMLLNRVRDRHYSVGLWSESQSEFDQIAVEIGTSSSAARWDELRDVGRNLHLNDSEPESISPDSSYQVRSVSVPLFDADGQIVVMLTLSGKVTLTGAEILERRTALDRAAATIHQRLGAQD